MSTIRSSIQTISGSDQLYAGYICYSHQDKHWAAWLQRSIEWYAVPRKLRGRQTPRGRVAKRCGKIFRDRTEAHADPDVYRILYDALDRSKCLLVVCSPAAAESTYCNDEIRHFRRRGGDRIFCLLVEGDPNETAPGKRAFPPALFEPLGTNEPLAAPLAADVRRGNDNKHDAKLKIIAALLGVGFDELRRRDSDRQRRQFAAGFAAFATFSLTLVTTYYFAILAGQRPPGHRTVIDFLATRNLILPTPIYSANDIADAGLQLEQKVSKALLDKGDATQWRMHGSGEVRTRIDTWTIGQTLSALLSERDLDAPHRRILLGNALMIPMLDGGPVERNGVKYGWYGYDAEHHIDETWPEEALWYASALSRALGEPDALLGGSARRAALAALDYAQRTTETYYDARGGGWDAMANQTNKTLISTYTTVTALQALLDAKAAGRGWMGSAARRDERIATTTVQLMRDVRPIDASLPGLAGLYVWKGERDDEASFEEGLTLETLATLLRAEAEAGQRLTPAVLATIPAHLEKVATATYAGVDGTSDKTAHFRIDIRVPDGSVRNAERYIDFAWYPWALACAELWLRRHPDAHSGAIARRALGHLVVDLGDAAAGDASYQHPWAAAELLVALDLLTYDRGTLYGLGFK
jgi:hypothetical protein